jgi:outer membrane protein
VKIRLLRHAVVLSAFLGLCRGQSAPMQLTLVQAQNLAVQNHPQLAASRSSALASHQVPLEVGAAAQPQLSGNLSGVEADNGSRLAAGFLNNPTLYSRIGAGVSLSQLVTDFGRTKTLVQSADLHAQALDQSTEATRTEILLSVDQAYFDELRAEAVLKVAQETVSARQLVVDQVTALQRSALRSTLDVSFANVNLSDAKLLLATAQNNISAAQVQLANVLGIPQQAQQGGFALSPEPAPGPLPNTVQPLVDQALRDRPDAAALRLEQTSAERAAKAEHDLNFPTVSVAGVFGGVPTGVSEVPAHYGAIGVNVNVPIFNGHLFKARQTEAELRAQAAAQNLKVLENRIQRDVGIAFLNATTAFQRIGLTAELLEQARMAAELSQIRYDNGLGSIVELSQAQLNVTTAEIANSSAEYDYQAERANLAFQAGALR